MMFAYRFLPLSEGGSAQLGSEAYEGISLFTLLHLFVVIEYKHCIKQWNMMLILLLIIKCFLLSNC